MGPIILALFAVGVLLAVLAFFTRRGPHETFRARSSPPQVPADAPGLAELTRRLMAAMGWVVEREERRGGWVDFAAIDPTPLRGQRVYVRSYAGDQPVESVEVLAASDNAHGEGFHKAVLIAPEGFSDEARAAAEGTAVELVDGPRLEELCRRYEVAPGTDRSPPPAAP